MSIALMLRVEALEKRVAELEAALAAFKAAPAKQVGIAKAKR